MILVDTSVWIDHFRRAMPVLVQLLEAGAVLTHPFVIGELACGSLANREVVLDLLATLPRAKTATDDETLLFIEERSLAGKGIGYIDVHLLAAVMLTDGARLWTTDRRLRAAADTLGLAYDATPR